ncbi:SHOCT domain-containing protein [Streptomyces bungoensis]|uniref:SHOCT domain-containing protein n=1 Tax=Streptomyces bungoensis TaxID=285568 RepID=UPI0034454C5E
MMYWNGGGWAWMALMPLVWIALIALAVWAVIRLTHGPSGGSSDRGERGRGRDGWEHWEAPGREQGHRESPEEILDRRYASGEIDSDTYTQARERLAAHAPKPR